MSDDLIERLDAGGIDNVDTLCLEAAARIRTLEAENAALRAALEPAPVTSGFKADGVWIRVIDDGTWETPFPAPVTVGEAAEELDDEGEIIRRLLSGETICYSQDGDDAWLSGGDKASLSERAILQLRKAGYLTRKNDDEGRVSWDEASDVLRALADAGEAG